MQESTICNFSPYATFTLHHTLIVSTVYVPHPFHTAIFYPLQLSFLNTFCTWNLWQVIIYLPPILFSPPVYSLSSHTCWITVHWPHNLHEATHNPQSLLLHIKIKYININQNSFIWLPCWHCFFSLECAIVLNFHIS